MTLKEQIIERIANHYLNDHQYANSISGKVDKGSVKTNYKKWLEALPDLNLLCKFEDFILIQNEVDKIPY